jgi:hypothetical protein
MIEYKKYNETCWWCAEKADSKEHRFKKSDIIREFGKGPFDKGAIIKILDDYKIENGQQIQGPNSIHLKFRNSLCKKCNNDRSQKFDIAYDKFISFIKSREETIFIERHVNLKNIYGGNWKQEFNNLLRYFIKNISCRLAENEIKIEKNTIEFLNGTNELQYFDFEFQIRMDFVEIYKHAKTINEDFPFVHASAIEGGKSKSMGSFYWLSGKLQYRWFQLTYIYNKNEINYLKSNNVNEVLILQKDYVIEPAEIRKRIKNTR